MCVLTVLCLAYSMRYTQSLDTLAGDHTARPLLFEKSSVAEVELRQEKKVQVSTDAAPREAGKRRGRKRRRKPPLQLHASNDTLARSEVFLYYCRSEKPAKAQALAWLLELYVRYLNKHWRRKKKFYLVERVLEQKHLVKELDMGFRSFLISTQRQGTLCLQQQLPPPQLAVYKKLIVISDAGEAGTTGDYNCTYIDLFFDRSRARVEVAEKRLECAAVHYLQGLMYLRLKQSSYKLEELCKKKSELQIMQRRAENRSGDVIFAATRLIKRSFHDFDALIRCAFFYLLKKQFPHLVIDGTHRFVEEAAGKEKWSKVVCEGNHLDMSSCKRRYKFSVDMENFSDDGYVTEKVFTGLLAETVPIYFGAPDIARYINPKRILVCSLPRERIEALRDMKGTYEFHVNGLNMDKDSYDPPRLLAAVAHELEKDLEPCLAEFAKIYRDQERYYAMLAERPFTNQAQMCSTSPILYGDFGRDMHAALLKIDSKKYNESRSRTPR